MALLLAGCDIWVGPAFYAPSEATNPITPGTYRFTDDKGKLMTARWDGHHVYQSGHRAPAKDEASLDDILAVPLQTDGRHVFILQIGTKPNEDAYYGFLEQRASRYILNFPNCSATQAIARDAGAQVHAEVVENVRDVDFEGMTLRQARMRTKQARGKAEPIEGESHANCRFATRASFEMAARRYIRERQLIGIKIERIAD
jgi:hypothetical protein